MPLTTNTLAKQVTKNADNYLLECYQSSIRAGELNADPHQESVMLELQTVFNTLLAVPTANKPPSRLSRFINFSANKPAITAPTKKGLYLWGGVGRGKTHLVDYFYKLVPIEQKMRLHFHRFMQLVHDELKTLDGVADPLHTVAKNMAAKTRLLCLDEMHVNDITDAMLLGKLFNYLFDRGVILVTTSNIPPNRLYRNGLQRERFLPAINLLETHTKVVQMGGDEDYRLKTLDNNAVYYLSSGDFPSALSEQRLENYFHKLSGIESHQDRTDIIVNKRRIPVKKWADGVVWFAFDDLCNTARSATDYTHIAQFFHTVLISDIEVMNHHKDDTARRFVNLIDTLYDMHTNIVISAFAEPEALYTGKRLAFEFQRTASRLREMQSADYITARHFS